MRSERRKRWRRVTVQKMKTSWGEREIRAVSAKRGTSGGSREELAAVVVENFLSLGVSEDQLPILVQLKTKWLCFGGAKHLSKRKPLLPISFVWDCRDQHEQFLSISIYPNGFLFSGAQIVLEHHLSSWAGLTDESWIYSVLSAIIWFISERPKHLVGPQGYSPPEFLPFFFPQKLINY